jgi:PAS domain S-box-containing protein
MKLHPAMDAMRPPSTDMKQLVGSFDWARTSLGPIVSWPQSLKTAADMVLASPVPMLLLWGRDGIMIYNDAYAAIAGSRHPNILGSPVLEAWPEVADFNRRVVETVFAGEPLSFKDKHFVLNRRGSPDDVWMNLDYSPVKGEDGSPAGVLGVVVETTPWVFAARAQRESESRFRTLAENIAQFAWMADESGSIFWYNKRWFDYTGTSLDEMKGWGWRKVHHPDHVDRVVEKISRCFKTGEVWEDTFPLRARDGAYRWFLSRAMPIHDETGKVVRWFGTNTDITEHLREAERNAQLATIVATSPDAIISLSETGTVLSWNPGAEKMFGYTAEEIVGTSERVLFREDADQEFKDKYDHLRLGEQVMLSDAVRQRKDGVLVDVAINAAPIRRPDGRILGFSAVIRDITERKRVEKHLRVVMRELSHRTKNLLAVIMAMVRQTARGSTDVDVLQSELIQRLQSLSASHDLLVAEDWAGASLEQLVRAVLQPFVGNASEAIECEGPSVYVNATAAQNLGLALHELATNAAKYGALSNAEGRVQVGWTFEPDSEGAPRLVIEWAERLGPPVEPPEVKGFGHVVIARVAAQALNATVVYEFPPEGVRWSIALPTDFVVNIRGMRSEAASAPA